MKITKRIGYGILSLLPFLGVLLIQAGTIYCAMYAILLFNNQYNIYVDGMRAIDVRQILLDHYTEIIAISQMATLLVFGLWYCLAYARKKTKRNSRILFRPGNLAGFLLIGFGLYLLIALCMAGIEQIAPDIMAEYNSYIEAQGVADLTFLSTVTTLVFAPLSEEIVFRGLTMNYMRKAGAPFILANLIQAAIFGLGHMNWIQSSYAFVLGILLGYLVRYFDTLAASMLLHMCFNFFGTYVAGVVENMPISGVFYIAAAVLAVLSLVLSYRLLKQNWPVRERAGEEDIHYKRE